MKQQNIKIAEFMGFTFHHDAEGDFPEGYWMMEHSLPMLAEEFDYHNSWGWLMPVVEKIESLGGDRNEFDIFGNCVQLGNEEFVGKSKKEAVYKAVSWWVTTYGSSI